MGGREKGEARAAAAFLLFPFDRVTIVSPFNFLRRSVGPLRV